MPTNLQFHPHFLSLSKTLTLKQIYQHFIAQNFDVKNRNEWKKLIISLSLVLDTYNFKPLSHYFRCGITFVWEVSHKSFMRSWFYTQEIRRNWNIRIVGERNQCHAHFLFFFDLSTPDFLTFVEVHNNWQYGNNLGPLSIFFATKYHSL